MSSKETLKLQKVINEKRDDIQDALHAASLNHRSLLLNVKNIKDAHPSQILKQTQNQFDHIKKVQCKFKQIQKMMAKRPQHHLNYLIIKQIQQEQISVRRDRLMDYQDKIYDQRRLISDKETFLQSLYRPKKKRPQHMAIEDFHQMRAKQKASEELQKIEILNKQKKQIQQLKNILCKPNQQLKNINKKINLQSTKTSSIQNVNNITAIAINQTCLNEPLSEIGGISQINIPMCRRHSTNQITNKVGKIQNKNDISIFMPAKKKQTMEITTSKMLRIKQLLDNINKTKSECLKINVQRVSSNEQNRQFLKQVQKYRNLYVQKTKRLKGLKEKNVQCRNQYQVKTDKCVLWL